MATAKKCNVKPIGVIDANGNEHYDVKIEYAEHGKTNELFPEPGYYFYCFGRWMKAMAVLWNNN